VKRIDMAKKPTPRTTTEFMRSEAAQTPPSRVGKKMLSVWIDEALYRDLKIVAATKGVTIQELADQGLGAIVRTLKE
jgi:hypothetical protein